MSESSRNPTTLDSSATSDLAVSSQPSAALSAELSIESYANELMDELFGDLERSLKRGATLPTEPVDLSPPVIEPAPPITLTSAMPLVNLAEPTLDDIDIQPLIEAAPPSQREWGPLLDRILLGITCLVLVATGVFWVVLQLLEQRSTPVATPSLTPEQIQAQLTAKENTAFLNYVQKSLNVLERRATTQPQTAAAQTEAGLPSVAVSPTGTVERVYIPVYQPPQALTQAQPTLPSARPNNLPNPPVTIPLPSVASAPVVPVAPAPNISPTVTHVLVGVLEQGDRSAALFEVNNIVQRIRLGESIGSSGWTLVEVQAGEALVRRNGEVRSIYVGQQF